MSRTFVLTTSLWLATAVAASADCTPGAIATPADAGWTLSVSAPCAPYQAVQIVYGPLEITEETGAFGTVILSLPVLAHHAQAQISIQSDVMNVPAPVGLASSGYIWISARDTQPELLLPVGFPEPNQVLPELGIFALGTTPEALDIPVTAARCGRSMAFSLMRDGWDVARDVVVYLPDCALAGSVLRLPVPSN